MLNLPQLIRELCNADSPPALSADEAAKLFAAMLDQAVPDLQLGALLAALRLKGTTVAELQGFYSALERRTCRLWPTRDKVVPVIIPSYHGAHAHPNLMPLVALLLARLEVPVLVHCTLEAYGGVSSAAVFRELGVLPCSSAAEAQNELQRANLALVPLSALAPGLAGLLSLRGVLGMRTCAHAAAKLLDPFAGESLRLIPASRDADCAMLREFIALSGSRALVMRATEGEAYADPSCRPTLELVTEGTVVPLFEAEHAAVSHTRTPPGGVDARATAAWIRRVLDGSTPLPPPLANQLACCLYGAGKTDDFNQAKAIIALGAHPRAA